MRWARHPDNGLYNLVAADARCNGAKRDFLASLPHHKHWRSRSIRPILALTTPRFERLRSNKSRNHGASERLSCGSVKRP